MAKPTKDRDRRAIADELRKKQAKKERRSTLIFVGAAVAVALIILAIPAKEWWEDRQRAGRDLSDIGVARSAASCQPVEKKDAQGSGDHVEPGTPIEYDTVPPAFGKHWSNFLQGPEIKNKYSVGDRPEAERLVHSLEHGYTILWYDETIGDDTAAMDDLDAIAAKYPVGDKVIIAPWTEEDGGAFPDGAHVALTHWTGPEKQQGVWEYCGRVSGPVVQEFVGDYSANNAPEPGAA